ncbi:uncharacterized protein LOC135811334 [Sycon ciliatum]|uniref:uncharacterized protein LOC135811334 n=1 Tax=Sycon ciliatum TaxID=27933 RepID=UPI0031F67BF0
MIRSPAFIREEDDEGDLERTIESSIVSTVADSPTLTNISSSNTLGRKMVAGIPQSQSWHSLSSFSLSKSRKQSTPGAGQTADPHRQTPTVPSSASSSRSDSGKSSGYASSTQCQQHLTVRPRSNTASPTTGTGACRRCGAVLCRWRKTHHNVVVCGAGGVGKSALLVQYLTHRFIYDYDPTLEESYHSFLALDGCCAELDITELAGQNLTESCGLFRSKVLGADGFIVVYDITDPSTLVEAERTIDHIQRELLTIPSASNSNRSSMSECVAQSPHEEPSHADRDAEAVPAAQPPPHISLSPATSEHSDSSTPTVPGVSPESTVTASGVASPLLTSPSQANSIPLVHIDKSNARSRDSLDAWSARDFPPIILIGNKCDLESERKVPTRDARQVSLETRCYFDEVSARSGHEGVDRVMAMLVQIMRSPSLFKDGALTPSNSGSRSGTPNKMPTSPMTSGSAILGGGAIAPGNAMEGPSGMSALAARGSVLTLGRSAMTRKVQEKRRRSQSDIYAIKHSGSWVAEASDFRSKTLSPESTRPSRHQWWLRASLRTQLVRFQTKIKSTKSKK